MKKTYLTPRTDFVLLQAEDVLTISLGDDFGMDAPAEKDQDWDIG